MNKVSIKKIQELFDKSIAEVFNDKHQNYDSVDKAQSQRILLVKGIKNFYFLVSLKLIEKYLTEMTKK